ncbi:TetR/AcrR family transcriptional regulator, partial [Paenibacillus sp. Y412MC10]|uniref:TetR/AcrR family transcriptional regulator n=1 Tax=Geobacillus sp. (strain Y412MC10) TaxID=481743 RepID=UPI0011AB8AE5
TNQIVKQAGLSKGMLFHFFQNKKSLFLYLAECCVQYFLEYMDQHKPSLSHEPFQRLLDIHQIKMGLFAAEPSIYKMSIISFIDRPVELTEDILRLEQWMQQKYLELYLNDLDLTGIRTDIAFEKMLGITLDSFEALTRTHVIAHQSSVDQGLSSLQTLLNNLTEYIEVLKYGLYENWKVNSPTN